jgi:clan AA aspartic protease
MTMIGSVNDVLEATLRVKVDGAPGQSCEIEALIDTGFNGFLTLPSGLIARLGLPWLFRQQGQLADGSFETFDVHQATIMWDNAPLSVEVEAVNAEPLLGMAVLEGYSLKVDVTKGGSVTIRLLA